jgi:subtilisin family serine protease
MHSGRPPLPTGRSVGSVVAAVAVGTWAVLVVWFWQLLAWGFEQALVVAGAAMPWWGWPLVCLLVGVLVAVPAVLLATFARTRATQVAGQLWARSAALLVGLGLAQAVPQSANWAYLLCLAVLAVVAAGVLPHVAWPGPRPPGKLHSRGLGGDSGRRSAGLLAIAAGLASMIAWLWLGALGGVLDSLAAALAALSLGFVIAALAERLTDQIPRLLPAALVLGVALLIVAGAAGASAVHLASMLVFPPLGLAAAALSRRSRRRLPLVLLVTLGTVGPLAFVDPIETSIVLGLQDVGYWALVAGLIALGAGMLLGTGYLILVGRARPATGPVRAIRIWPAATLAGLLTLAAGTVYATAGHPGLYGDELFVVMKAQADLTGLDQIADLTTRRTATYRRLVDLADHSQVGIRHALTAWHLRYTPYYLVNGLQVDAGPVVRAWLAARSDVDRVLLSPRLRPLPAPAPAEVGADGTVPDGLPQWNISMIHADQVWATGDTGAGVVIGTSDTGVDAGHPALAGSFRGGSDSWYDPWNGTRAPTDHNGHGTHTLGTVLGRDGIGVAPGAQWMGCVNLDRNLGNPAWYLDCLQFMLAPFEPGGNPFTTGNPARSADVLTNSWGCPDEEGCDGSALRPAIDALTAAGIFVVVAAGNTGPHCGTITDPPAPYPDSLTVGAVDRAGRLAAFSSRGPAAGAIAKPDLVAPGVDVLSAAPDGGFAHLDGTSMATPHVAGVVALMWSANPHLIGQIRATAAILRDTAAPVASVGRCGKADGVGAGLVDAAAAVRAARAYG